MAKIITVTTSHAETAVDFGAYYQFAWVKNLSDDTDCYISDHSGASAEDDDVALVSAGSSAMIVTSGDTIYIIGSGVKCECRAQNFAECPFGDLAGESGGESITIGPTPTQGSSNAVSSGGVYTALQNIPKPVDYSTTEQDTGRKWIDGKPIYQKTYVKTAMGEYSNELPANLETMVNMESILKYTQNSVTIITPIYATDSSDYYGVYFADNTLVLRDTHTSSGTDITVVVTIYYTKTTDTAE